MTPTPSSVESAEQSTPYTFRDWYIPDRMMEALTRYVEQHVPTGDFLLAVLENNLSEAVGRADDENLQNLPAYVAYLYNEVPSTCHGSPEKVTAWLAKVKQP
ncbi:MAG: hypothetical protein NUV51_03605 [Sulfuricaulis sp.]|nr:hypothetical protein [Sulfuricaulis sp.]